MTDLLAAASNIGSDISVDRLFDGRMICLQPRRGYRYSIDSILLAHFTAVESGDFILDLGCGCGIIGLIMTLWHQARLRGVVGLELQPELARLAGKNVELNGFGSMFFIVRGDLRLIRSTFTAESFSRVVCNPPFYTSSSGRQTKDRQARIARHQICSSTDQMTAAAAYAVRNKGVVSIVFPAQGLAELICSLEKVRLRIKRMQPVFSYPSHSTCAELVLVEARKNGGQGMKVDPPFYIYKEKNGDYSDEMQNIYRLPKEMNKEVEPSRKPT